ncbi:hypothetical protein MicloDRAFT_00034650 [Microvirga lotononidis]|uniref:Uncharacterized protein n=2 Tax=Microvirga lotononidis TaxID=864069 RepID=I4YSH2_9HYPH|nr:hypothetical protein MicloDRAFT_00034650 [Microvirga lotononidis]
MARTTKSVSRARTTERGASKKGVGKRAATRGRSAERGAVKRGTARKGATKRGSRAALEVRGWMVNFVSGESLQLEADAVNIDSSGTVTFSLFGNDVLSVSAANYNFIMETSEPLESSEEETETDR